MCCAWADLQWLKVSEAIHNCFKTSSWNFRKLQGRPPTRSHFLLNIDSINDIFKLVSQNCHSSIRGGSRTPATSKMKRFAIIVNGFQPLTYITEHSILDVAAALNLLLSIFLSNTGERLSYIKLKPRWFWSDAYFQSCQTNGVFLQKTVNRLFWYPLNTSENPGFSDVFRGYSNKQFTISEKTLRHRHLAGF